ncbi:MAG TPA: hypothetical protein DEA40_01960 [Parvularcula sp.]|nr:hypothetical protein [Parvularcula sp.]HBS33602.1 hypothetical protein [Parvularcula sp.]
MNQFGAFPLRSLFAAAAVLLLSACDDQSAVPDGNPRSARIAGPHGAIWPEDAIVGPAGAAWAQQVIEGYERAGASAAPTRIEPLDTSSCVLTKPAPGAVVRQVFVEQGAGAPPLFVLRQNEKSASAEAARLRVVNVVVTESSAPVHLVLASERSVIWNIIPAPDARVSGVTALSGASLGVANAPDGAAIEALYGEALSRCEVAPVRRPQDDWGLAREARAGGPALTQYDARNAQADKFEAWLRKWFGAGVETAVIAPMGAGAALVGPLPPAPAARIPMRPIAGATLKLSIDGRLIVGDERDFEAAAAENGAKRGV